MYSETTNDMGCEFEVVRMRREASSLTRPADVERAKAIQKKYDKEVRVQEKKYALEKDTRVAKRLKVLIDKAGDRSRHLAPRFFGTDKFNEEVLTRRALRDVEFDHQRRIASIRQREVKELGEFLKTVQQRDEQKQALTRAFNHTSDEHKRKEGQQPTKPTYTRKRT